MPINSSPRGFYRNARPLLVLGLTIFVLFALKKEMHYQHFLDGRHDVYETFDPTSALSRVMSGVVGTSNQQRPNDTSVDLPLGQRACDSFPNMDGISFVMKTGASEAYKKLPTQLSTYMRCIPDTLIFSDKVSARLGNLFFSSKKLTKSMIRRTKSADTAFLTPSPASPKRSARKPPFSSSTTINSPAPCPKMSVTTASIM